jgi:hypothetical protein
MSSVPFIPFDTVDKNTRLTASLDAPMIKLFENISAIKEVRDSKRGLPDECFYK